MNTAAMRHGHPGKSCLHPDTWHMVFSRQLTDEEWSKIGRMLDIDPATFDREASTWQATRCSGIVRLVCPDVSIESVGPPIQEELHVNG